MSMFRKYDIGADFKQTIKAYNIDYTNKLCNFCSSDKCDIVCTVCLSFYYCSKEHRTKDEENHQQACKKIFNDNSIICKICKTAIDIRFLSFFDLNNNTKLINLQQPYEQYDLKYCCYLCRYIFHNTNIQYHFLIDNYEELDRRITMTKRDLDDTLRRIILLENMEECTFCSKKDNIMRCTICNTFKSCSSKCLKNNLFHNTICSSLKNTRREFSDIVYWTLESGQFPEYAVIEYTKRLDDYIICLRNHKYCEFQLHNKFEILRVRMQVVPIVVIFFNSITKKISHCFFYNKKQS